MLPPAMEEFPVGPDVQEMDDPRELQLRNPHSYLHCFDPSTVVAQRERQPPQELHLWNQTVFSGGHSPSSELLELVVA